MMQVSVTCAHDELSALRSERDGYKNAYEIVQSELNNLRMTAGPVVRRSEERRQTSGKPSIFLATLPKSGTVFISHSLRQTLGLDYTSTMVTPTFPKNVIWPEALEDFCEGGMISASHMQPDADNLVALKAAGVTKGIVHVRDPRAALYSWVRFAPKKAPLYHSLVLNADYRSMSESDRIDHAIDAGQAHQRPYAAEPVATLRLARIG